ncbi:MAG: hypothetical protein AAGA96_18665 [Verrucomicrobiota bacterium]
MGSPAFSKDLTTQDKLKHIVLPEVVFDQQPFHDCLDALAAMSKQLDPSDNPTGVQFENQVPAVQNVRITLRLGNVPLAEAIRYTTSLANTAYRVENGMVEIVPIREQHEDVVTMSYQIPPQFARKFTEGPPLLVFLKEGINFEQGSSVEFDPSTSLLTIKNQGDQILQAETYLSDLLGFHPVSIDSVSSQELKKKLESLTIPRVEFWETPLADVFELVQQKALEHDPEENPSEKGINLVLEITPELAESKSSFILTDASLEELLQYISEVHGLRYDLTDGTVLIRPQDSP